MVTFIALQDHPEARIHYLFLLDLKNAVGIIKNQRNLMYE